MTRVLITLTDDARNDPQRKHRVRALVTSLGMRGINEKRFDRYGILSGEIDETALVKLESVHEIAAVERDQQRQAL